MIYKRAKKIVPLFVVPAAIGFIIVLSIMDGRMPREKAVSGSETETADRSIMFGVRLQHEEEGKKVWRLTAAKAEFFEGKGVVMLYTPVAVLEKEDEEVFRIRAERGEIVKKKKKIVLGGNVDLVGKNVSLKTDRLEYYWNKRVLATQRPFVIRSDAFEVRGARLIMEVGCERLRVEKNVKTFLWITGG